MVLQFISCADKLCNRFSRIIRDIHVIDTQLMSGMTSHNKAAVFARLEILWGTPSVIALVFCISDVEQFPRWI